MEIEVINRLLDYGLSIAVVVVVAYLLNRKNNQLESKNTDLVEKMHHKDLENLKTLEAISRLLDDLKIVGSENHKEIKEHVSERAREIRDEISRYGK
jgi:uncharacterized membrane protein